MLQNSKNKCHLQVGTKSHFQKEFKSITRQIIKYAQFRNITMPFQL